MAAQYRMALDWVAAMVLLGEFLPAPEATAACGAALHAMPGVWISRDRALPIYYDLRLTAYLTSLGRRLNAGPVAILPAYSAEVLCFARDSAIFVSTGLLLQVENEQDLERRLAAKLANVRRKRGRSGRLSPCALLASPADRGFADLREELARQVERYEDLIRPGCGSVHSHGREGGTPR